MLARMLYFEFEARPEAREVASELLALAEQLPPPSLRAWAREVVPKIRLERRPSKAPELGTVLHEHSESALEVSGEIPTAAPSVKSVAPVVVAVPEKEEIQRAPRPLVVISKAALESTADRVGVVRRCSTASRVMRSRRRWRRSSPRRSRPIQHHPRRRAPGAPPAARSFDGRSCSALGCHWGSGCWRWSRRSSGVVRATRPSPLRRGQSPRRRRSRRRPKRPSWSPGPARSPSPRSPHQRASPSPFAQLAPRARRPTRSPGPPAPPRHARPSVPRAPAS